VGGYQGNLFKGFTGTGLNLLKKYCRSQEKVANRVNIIGFPAHLNIYWKGDMEEIRRLLSILGLEVQCFYPGDVSLEQIKKIPSAALNLVVDDALGIEMAEYLEEAFGTPYVTPPYGSLIGIDNTMEFLESIVETLRLKKELLGLVEAEKTKALEMACQSHHVWFEMIQHATNFAISAHGSMAVGMVRLLMCELGMEPKAINLSPAMPGDKEKILKLLRDDGREFEPAILENKDNYEFSQAFKDEWPTLIFGKGTTLKSEAFMNETKAFITIAYPAYDRKIIYNRPIMGFNGVPVLLDDIMTRLFYFF
jgi:nitrogenase molybdenum-iron protein beta chain